LLRLRLPILIRSLVALLVNGNGHELVGARLALALVLHSPRRALEVAGFTLGLASWLLVMVAALDAVLGLGIFPADPPHEQLIGPVDQDIAPPER
jgi:hypothetical protein